MHSEFINRHVAVRQEAGLDATERGVVLHHGLAVKLDHDRVQSIVAYKGATTES